VLRVTTSHLGWLIAYLAMLALVTRGVFYGRQQALAVYGSAEAQTEWDAWRSDAKKMAEQPSTVKRRAPKSAEPPALVLMRDYFVVCFAGAVVLSTVLFGTFMLLVQGACRVGCAHQTKFIGGHSPPYDDD
jgi:hypothetical protein